MIRRLRYQKRRSRIELKKSRRRKSYLKQLHIRQQRKEIKIRYRKDEKPILHINVPELFSVIKYPEVTLKFIKELKHLKFDNKIKHIFLDLEKIKSIDIGSICILLSIMHELKGKSIAGNYPKDEECRRIFEESDFFSHVRSNTSKTNNKNFIIKIGSDKTLNSSIGAAIKKSIYNIVGKEQHYPPVYSIVQEMAGNSIEHAFDKKKCWFFSINFDDSNNKINFVFTDNGHGIIKTLKRRFGQQFFKDILRGEFNENSAILRKAFDQKYGSRTEEINRNKGLPKIKAVVDEEHITDLIVLSNKAYLNLGQNKKAIELKNEFQGTFYCWSVDKSNIELWEKKKTE